jgi:thiamine-phosphate pyrophosphorylase
VGPRRALDAHPRAGRPGGGRRRRRLLRRRPGARDADYAPVGLDLVRYAARVAPVGDVGSKPWFAIGGLDADNLDQVIEAGARRVVVVRAITGASDPEAAARVLKDRLGQAWADDPALASYALRSAALDA